MPDVDTEPTEAQRIALLEEKVKRLDALEENLR